MRFSDIPAHQEVKARLRALVDDNRLPHAILLEGPPGVGKFAMARALAAYIHCEHRTPEGDACGHCPSCVQHATFNQPDTFYSFPVVTKGSAETTTSDDYAREWQAYLHDRLFMNLGQWQVSLNNPNGQTKIYAAESQSVIRKFSTTSYSSRYKILIQWLPERMNVECANKMLKLIEEPYDDSVMVFVSDQPQEILPTVYSRLQRIRLKPLPESVVEDYLIRTHGLDAATAQLGAHLAEGSITRAEMQLTEAEENRLFLSLFTEVMRSAWQRKILVMKDWADRVAALGRETEIRFLAYCERMMRENFILNIGDQRLVYLNADEMTFSSRFSPFINERNVEALLREFGDARRDIAANGNGRIVLFDLAVKIILLLKS